jgi:predicted NBD/HSP70 family sugar kinase
VSTGVAGRPSIVVEPSEQHVFVVAIDIGVEHLVAARVGLGGAVLDRRSVGQPRTDYDIGVTLGHIRTLVRRLLRAAPAGAVCAGVGVGVCGLVGSETGVVRFAPNLGWVDVPLRDLLVKHLGVSRPIVIGNDGDLGALAEHTRGAGRGAANLVYLSGEVGLGGGIILDGRALGGAGGYAGEIGHMCVNPKGRWCRCGRRGCWETEVGEEAIMLATGRPIGTSLDEVLAAYEAGDLAVRRGLVRIGDWLGTGVADLVNIFNPELVIFGGMTRDIFRLAEEAVRKSLTTALTAPRDQVRLAPPGLGADSTLLGAAELAFAPLLDNPLAA